MKESQELWNRLSEEQRERLFVTMHTYLSVADAVDLIVIEMNSLGVEF